MSRRDVRKTVNKSLDKRVTAIAIRADRHAEERRVRAAAADRAVAELPVWSRSTFGGAYEELRRVG